MSALPPIDVIRKALPTLPPRLRQVGEFLAHHEFDATTRSMRGLAASAGINPATFTRLAQAIGYAGWDGLRAALIEAGRLGRETPFSTRVPGIGGPAPASIGQAMLQSDVETLARITSAPIAAAAAALHAASRVWVAGFRSCRSVADLLQYQLRLFRPGMVNRVGGGGPEDLDYGAFEPGDALVVIGFAPYSRASIAAAVAGRAARCVTIAVADSPTAPIAEGADHLLLFDGAASPGFFPSLTGAISLAQALAAAAFTLGGPAALIRLQQTEARLAAHAQYVPDQD